MTEGAQGIGAATVRRLSEDGANVIALDLDGAGAKTAVEGLPPRG